MWVRGGVPSRSVFRKVASKVAENWSRFQECVLSPDALEKLLAGAVRGVAGVSTESSPADGNGFSGELETLGWKGNLPTLYCREVPASSMPRLVRPRIGVIRGSGVDSVGGDVGVLDIGGGDVANSSRKRYPRDWRAYNTAQGREFKDAKAVLGGLSDLINLMEARLLGPRGKGRPRCGLGHVVYAALWKAYTGLSARRLLSVLEDAVKQGYLRDVPSCVARGGGTVGSSPPSGMGYFPKPNTVGDCLRAEWLTPLLLELVSVVAGPLREVDSVFAIDGTGLSTRIYERWLDVKPQNEPPGEAGGDGSQGDAEGERKGWVKLHALCGVGTNVMVRVAISPSNHHDNSYYRGLVIEGSLRFDMRKVAADLGYLDGKNFDLGE